jgi:RNA polymerase sigma factor (sigma-70 family)
LLQTDPDIKVVGSVGNGKQAVEAVTELRPGVVVMDISMPELDGIEATRQIFHLAEGVKVIVLSIQDSGEHVLQALQAGASGYLLKESAGSEVIQAVHVVADGGRYFSQAVMDLLVQSYVQNSPENENDEEIENEIKTSLLESLSPREKEVFQLVTGGKSSMEISKILQISPKTVETYRSRLMVKLEVSDLTSLIRLAAHGSME